MNQEFKDKFDTDIACWKIVCNELYGGCGIEMQGDSKEEVLEKRDKRI